MNIKAQSSLPLAAIIPIAIIIFFVIYLVSRTNVNLNDRDVEVFIGSFAVAGVAFVWLYMRQDKLKMEGV